MAPKVKTRYKWETPHRGVRMISDLYTDDENTIPLGEFLDNAEEERMVELFKKHKTEFMQFMKEKYPEEII